MPGFEHMELDEKSKPRKLAKEDTVRLKKDLQIALKDAVADDQVLPLHFMQNLATEFCEVPPKDVSSAKLLSDSAKVSNED